MKFSVINKIIYDSDKQHNTINQALVYKFNFAWLRLKSAQRLKILEIIQNNSIQSIKESKKLSDEIFKLFAEVIYITEDVGIIVMLIKNFETQFSSLTPIGNEIV
jgi:hypothetical protein